MRHSRLSEEQTIGILKEPDAGTTSAEVGRRYDISPVTFYHWKARLGGVNELVARG